jgi:hypothetical protein
MTAPLEHALKVTRDNTPPVAFRATCACGMRSALGTRQAAQLACRRHEWEHHLHEPAA